MTVGRQTRRYPSRWPSVAGVAAVGVVLTLALAACGSTKSTSASPAPSVPAASPGTTTAGGPAGVTISSADVPGVGTVLVNGQGMTLYLLSSEQGTKLTCTDENNCTKIWPDTELPAGVKAATAGAGVQASMLGTVKGSSGSLYVTYAGWPLYTFSHDSGPGSARGEGIMSFGGTWKTLRPAGTPVEPTATSPSTTVTTKALGY